MLKTIFLMFILGFGIAVGLRYSDKIGAFFKEIKEHDYKGEIQKIKGGSNE